MANLNKVFLMGRLTRDPEVRHTPQGQSVTELGLAVNRVWRDQGGELREETCFVDVSAWGGRGETVARYLNKGSPIFVEGRLTFHSWENAQGEKRSKLRVTLENFQFLDSRQNREGGGGAYQGESQASRPQEARAAQASRPQEGSYGSGSGQPPVQDDLGLEGEEEVPF